MVHNSQGSNSDQPLPSLRIDYTPLTAATASHPGTQAQSMSEQEEVDPGDATESEGDRLLAMKEAALARREYRHELDEEASDSGSWVDSVDEVDFFPQETEARPEEQRACIFEDRLEKAHELKEEANKQVGVTTTHAVVLYGAAYIASS